MNTKIFYPVIGEIIAVKSSKSLPRRPLIYVCKVSWPDGSVSTLGNVMASTMFGGIDDYLQFRSRAAADVEGSGEFTRFQNKENASTGDRVIIQFINGNIQQPIITGYSQHPNQTYEFETDTPADIDPQLIFKYLGFKVSINEEGEVLLIRRGAPTISFDPQAESQFGTGFGNPLDPPNPLADPESIDQSHAQVEPQDDTEVVMLEFLKGGQFRVRDANGQVIEMNREDKQIIIQNNGLKSTDRSLFPSADYEKIILDDGEESITINARSLLKYTTAGDMEDSADGDRTIEVGGDLSIEVEGEMTENISKSREITAAKGFSIDAGGALFKLKDGKVGMGSSSVEIIDLFVKLNAEVIAALKEITDQANQSTGNLGFSTIINPGFVAKIMLISQKVEKLKADATSIKGGV